MNKITKLYILASFLMTVTCSSLADGPIFYQRYSADPWGLVYNGRLYLYCSHDRFEPGTRYIMNDITCISTVDMKNWTDHGEVFHVKDSKWGAKLSWAPSVVLKDGNFYLYFGDGDKAIGVAVSDSPTGPFIDSNPKPVIDKNTPGVLLLDSEGNPKPNDKNTPGKLNGSENWGFWCFDPSVLIDDDGQVYMYFGGAHPDNSRVIKLKSNMVEPDGSAIKVNTPGFFEASYVHKYKGKYYYSYSGHYFNKPTNIEYVVSDNPMSGFDNVGIVMKNPPVNDGYNHHQSIFTFGGNWYMAYHNRQLAHDNSISDIPAREFMRSVCIDQLFYNEDGTIQVVIATKDGLEQLKNVNSYVLNEAETMAKSFGGINTTTLENGRCVNEIRNGSWIMVKGVDFGEESKRTFEAKVASGTVGGFIELHLDSPDGKMIGKARVGNTGGWDKWKNVSASIPTIGGVHDLYLVFSGDMGNLMVFDNWIFK